MAATLRTAKTSVAGALETVKSIKKTLESPIPLTENDSKYFDAIVRAREASSWDTLHLIMAAQLAQSLGQLDLANSDIADRGIMIENARGTPIVNPSVSAKTSLAGSVMQLSRTLGLSASQKGLSGKPQAARNEADREARKLIESASSDELLA
jgi:phage terminase small subunit